MKIEYSASEVTKIVEDYVRNLISPERLMLEYGDDYVVEASSMYGNVVVNITGKSLNEVNSTELQHALCEGECYNANT